MRFLRRAPGLAVVAQRATGYAVLPAVLATTAARYHVVDGFRAGVLHLMRSWYPHLRRCFLSISQSRKSRGGKDFELQIEGLLTLAGLPFDRQIRKDTGTTCIRRLNC